MDSQDRVKHKAKSRLVKFRCPNSGSSSVAWGHLTPPQPRGSSCVFLCWLGWGSECCEKGT